MIKADAEDMASLKAGSERSNGKKHEDDKDSETGGQKTFADRAKEQRGAKNVQKLREKME